MWSLMNGSRTCLSGWERSSRSCILCHAISLLDKPASPSRSGRCRALPSRISGPTSESLHQLPSRAACTRRLLAAFYCTCRLPLTSQSLPAAQAGAEHSPQESLHHLPRDPRGFRDGVPLFPSCPSTMPANEPISAWTMSSTW